MPKIQWKCTKVVRWSLQKLFCGLVQTSEKVLTALNCKATQLSKGIVEVINATPGYLDLHRTRVIHCAMAIFHSEHFLYLLSFFSKTSWEHLEAAVNCNAWKLKNIKLPIKCFDNNEQTPGLLKQHEQIDH